MLRRSVLASSVAITLLEIFSVDLWSIIDLNNIKMFPSASKFWNIYSDAVLAEILMASPSVNSVVYTPVSNSGFTFRCLIRFPFKSRFQLVITDHWYPLPLGKSTFIVRYSSDCSGFGTSPWSGVTWSGSLGFVLEMYSYPKGVFYIKIRFCERVAILCNNSSA